MSAQSEHDQRVAEVTSEMIAEVAQKNFGKRPEGVEPIGTVSEALQRLIVVHYALLNERARYQQALLTGLQTLAKAIASDTPFTAITGTCYGTSEFDWAADAEEDLPVIDEMLRINEAAVDHISEAELPVYVQIHDDWSYADMSAGEVDFGELLNYLEAKHKEFCEMYGISEPGALR